MNPVGFMASLRGGFSSLAFCLGLAWPLGELSVRGRRRRAQLRPPLARPGDGGGGRRRRRHRRRAGRIMSLRESSSARRQQHDESAPPNNARNGQTIKQSSCSQTAARIPRGRRLGPFRHRAISPSCSLARQKRVAASRPTEAYKCANRGRSRSLAARVRPRLNIKLIRIPPANQARRWQFGYGGRPATDWPLDWWHDLASHLCECGEPAGEPYDSRRSSRGTVREVGTIAGANRRARENGQEAGGRAGGRRLFVSEPHGHTSRSEWKRILSSRRKDAQAHTHTQ